MSDFINATPPEPTKIEIATAKGLEAQVKFNKVSEHDIELSDIVTVLDGLV